MFQIGFGELLVVGIVALWALGPERLPGTARVLGRWLRKARDSYASIKKEFTAEFDKDDRR